MARLRFVKMQGLSNDYIYIDCFEQKIPDPPAIARALSPRGKAVGSDGLVLILPSKQADCRMEIYNADGSRAEMCGNGIRCVGKYLYEHRSLRHPNMTIETDCGIKQLELEVANGLVELVTVDMGVPDFKGDNIPLAQSGAIIEQPFSVGESEFIVTCLSIGNPHCVVFMESLAALDILALGPRFEQHPTFPKRTNTEFAEVIDRNSVRVRVWERGSGETLACGTGACATVVAGSKTGRLERKAVVHLRGGSLWVEWGEDQHVRMKGPAVEVFRGDIDLEEVLSCSQA